MQPPERGEIERLGVPRQVLVFLGITGWYLARRTTTFNPGALALSPAPGYQAARRQPADPANGARGRRALLLARGQWRQRPGGRWSLYLIANDALGPGSHRGRLRAARRLSAGLTVGPSPVRQGDRAAGPGRGFFARWPIAHGWHLEPEAGYPEYAGLAGVGYAGFGLDRAY